VSGWGNTLGSICLASIRDLQWRSRRFLSAAIATGLVFGVLASAPWKRCLGCVTMNPG